MSVSHELLSRFAKLVTKNDNTNVESIVYGTIVDDGEGNKYVKLDGSDQLTPLSNDERPVADLTTANANVGERVTVLIKNHTATVTGNVSSPAARSGDIEDLDDELSKIQEFDVLIGDQIQVIEGYIEVLRADKADIGELTAVKADIEDLKADKADIGELTAVKADIKDLKADKIDAEVVEAEFVRIDGELVAVKADINNLNVDYGKFKELTTNSFTAYDAEIKRLETEKLSVSEAEIKYANIDFSNIGEAAIEKVFSKSGIIKDLIVSEGKITGELVGVTIRGDLIEGNTIKADKLVVKGSDGLYYKLNIEGGAFTEGEIVPDNTVHGSVITAYSITAEKVTVDDLVAFDATIGGFKITTDSIYSGVKSSVDNTTQGIYLDNEGQAVFGDSTNFFKYYRDQNGNYKLEISADSILIGASKKNIEEEIATLKLSSDQMNLQFQDITNNGVTKVTTETGFTFDREGMTIDNTDSPTKTQVTPDGMTVYKKDASGTQEEVLEATSEGVDATNLHAKTYLIVGGRSRFENYGSNRTGCFWIGG